MRKISVKVTAAILAAMMAMTGCGGSGNSSAAEAGTTAAGSVSGPP